MLSEKIPPSELIILPETIPIFNKLISGFKSELYSPENFVKDGKLVSINMPFWLNVIEPLISILMKLIPLSL